MFRKEINGATIPSPEGVEIPGVGTVSAPLERRGWFSRHANGMRIAADGVAAAGLMAVQGLVTAKTGSITEGLTDASLIGTAAMGLLNDAAYRLLSKDLDKKQFVIEPPKGTEIPGVGTISTPPQESTFGKAFAKVIFNSSQIVGNPTLVFLTGKLIEARNIPEAILTGAAEIVLLSNVPRNREIVRRLDEDK
jgi:hypothetical protein